MVTVAGVSEETVSSTVVNSGSVDDSSVIVLNVASFVVISVSSVVSSVLSTTAASVTGTRAGVDSSSGVCRVNRTVELAVVFL